MSTKKNDLWKVGHKVCLNDPTRKLLIGIITEVAPTYMTVYWEDETYKNYSFFFSITTVTVLTEQEARNFFPDRYDKWIKQPGAKNKLTTTQFLILAGIIAVLALMVVLFMYNFFTK